MRHKLKGVEKNSFYKKAEQGDNKYKNVDLYPKERNVDANIDLFDYEISEYNFITIIKK